MVQLPTEQESKMLIDYILLPVVLTVFERDMKVIEQSNIKLKEPYLKLIQQSMDKVTKDLAKIRAEFRKSGIRVYEDIRNNKEIGCKYVCRGYHHDFSMQWPVVKARVQLRVEKYLGVK